MDNIISIPLVYPVTCHTDHVGTGSTFVAIKGMKEDGTCYIAKALDKGASTIVVEESCLVDINTLNLIHENKALLIYVSDARKALAQLSAKASNYPAKSLRIIAITGTKGKTTTSLVLEHILRKAGHKTALISSVKNKILNQEFPANLTTPQPDYLHVFFDVCKQNSVEYVIMEVAAQALSLNRIDSIYFDAAIFTNFSLEHSEFYSNIDQYFAAKVSIFNHLKEDSLALLNADDRRILLLSGQLKRVVTYGLGQWGDIKASVENCDLSGLIAKIKDGEKAYELKAPHLVGKFNVYNVLAATICAKAFNVSIENINKALNSFSGVPGRLEKFMLKNGSTAFIDYAHNPSSFEAVLSALRSLTKKLIVVFGAGGEKDNIKRPLMGSIAAQLADIVMLTNDNPRSEEPEDIIKQIKSGINQQDINKIYIELDRELAIKKAYAMSEPDSILVLLGKGRDEFQIIKGNKMPFSEATILRSLQKDAIINSI